MFRMFFVFYDIHLNIRLERKIHVFREKSGTGGFKICIEIKLLK